MARSAVPNPFNISAGWVTLRGEDVPRAVECHLCCPSLVKESTVSSTVWEGRSPLTAGAVFQSVLPVHNTIDYDGKTCLDSEIQSLRIDFQVNLEEMDESISTLGSGLVELGGHRDLP